MKKSETIGIIGENLFHNILLENRIKHKDLRNSSELREIDVYSRGNQPAYSYIRRVFSHPFDFIVNGKNIEVKTSSTKYNDVCFTWYNNDKYNIDYVIGLSLNKDKTLKDIFIFDNNYVSSHKGYRANYKRIDNMPIISKKELLKLLKK